MKAAVEFVWWVRWGLQSHFHVQPNNCVEVVLRCVGVGVVTINFSNNKAQPFHISNNDV